MSPPSQAPLQLRAFTHPSHFLQMERANLLETLENVVPQDVLLRIAPVLAATSTRTESLSSLRESAAARFQNGSVGGSDDEKPEPLSESSDTENTRSPRPSDRASLMPSRRSSMWAGDAPSAASRLSEGSEGKRHSMWAGGSPSSAAASTRRLSLSTRSGQSDSPSPVTVSPVAQRQEQLPSSSAVSGRTAQSSDVSKRGSMWAGDAPSAASRLSNVSKGRRHSMVRFS